MAKSQKVIAQDYPRIQDESSPYHGCLDDAKLVPHKHRLAIAAIKKLIRLAIDNANKKSCRAILSIPEDATQQEIDALYAKGGKELFKYFKKYCGDPASTAHQIHGKHYREVGREQFHNRTLQKERMNSGWRYQFLAVDCARQSNRFKSVSDIGAAEGDFNAVIAFRGENRRFLASPFFAEYSCQEMMTMVLEVLMESYAPDELPNQIEIPDKLLASFGESCRQAGLLDDKGCFHDPRKLVAFFCN